MKDNSHLEACGRQRCSEEERRRLDEEDSQRTRDLNATINALESEIAERKRIGEKLTRSRERLMWVSRRTLNILEADRRVISKDLHDSIGASLAAIKFSLEEKEMKRAQNHGHLKDSLEQEIAYLLAAIKETKRISANLRPTILDDLGLMATLTWYLRQFHRLYEHVHVHFSAEVAEGDLSESLKITIYRIVQEGLANAVKHGDARNVWLQLKIDNDGHCISLVIKDDGRGFELDTVLGGKDPMGGYGLTAMRERCEIFGGDFHIESRIGQGTRIQATLPRYEDELACPPPMLKCAPI